MRSGLVGVLEPDATGHRLHYVRHLLLADPARCVVLTSERAVRSEEFAAHRETMAASTVVLPVPETQSAWLRAAVDWAEAAGARHLVVLEGDKYLVPLLGLVARRRVLSLEISLLLLRTASIAGPKPLRPATVAKPILVQLLRICPRIRFFFLTDAFGVVVKRRGYPGLRPVKDPVQRTGLSGWDPPGWFPPAEPAKTCIGLFGVISRRKNLPLLVAAAAEITQAVLVVAGRLEPDMRAFVDTDPRAASLAAEGRMLVVDRLLGPAEFARALASVDVAAVLHDNDSPSGILAEACVRHTPVLVPRGGWLANVVASTGVGTSTPLTVEGVVDGIGRMRRDRDLYVAATYRRESCLDTVDFTRRLLGR